MARIRFPRAAQDRGVGFWIRPRNLWRARRKYRVDQSRSWRDAFESAEIRSPYLNRAAPFSDLCAQHESGRFRFVVLGDTGEGDHSQYGLLPLLRALKPDFMIINGDVAYPAGNMQDYVEGFFEPYEDFGIPVWAVPGNHDYYSSEGGREFIQIFCTRKHELKWSQYGLRLVPQPGTYWELNDYERSGGRSRLVVIGIDTLQSGNLDGHGWFGFPRSADSRQLNWLKKRLDVAESSRPAATVMILFHIPALVREQNVQKVYLKELHSLIASYQCVKLVVTAHEHSFQLYSQEVFGNYLKWLFEGATPQNRPHYAVSGGGGAFLSSPHFKHSRHQPRFPANRVYPDAVQWDRIASKWRSIVRTLGLQQSVIDRVADMVGAGAVSDPDLPHCLSFLLVEVNGHGQTDVTPVFMDDVQLLFTHLPGDQAVKIDYPDLDADPQAVKACLQTALRMRL